MTQIKRDDYFHIAAFQGTIKEDNVDNSVNTMLEAMEWAQERKVDVLCMPESFLQGYYPNREEAWEHAIDLGSSDFRDICSRFKGYDTTLLFGLNERRGDKLYNTEVVIEGGECIGKYSKTFLVYDYFEQGNDFPVFDKKGVKYGIIICKDSSYMEASRILAMRGAQVIFSPHFNRCEYKTSMDHIRRVRSHHVARAVENACWMVRANVIWPYDGEKVGYGDCFIMNEIGEIVCRGDLVTETILHYEIPKNRLRGEDACKGRAFWESKYSEAQRILCDEYRKIAESQEA